MTPLLRWVAARQYSSGLHGWASAFALSLLGIFGPLATTAAAGPDTIVVKFRENVIVPDDTTLPAALGDGLTGALGSPYAVSGRLRDGAYQLALPQGWDLEATRAALNRVRLDANVLYASLAPGAPVPDTTGRPTDRIIVKYRDPALVANSRAGVPLDAAQMSRLTGLARRPLAWLRGGHDGSNILQMLQRLPIGQVEAIVALIAAQSDVDYAQPDYIRTAQIVPTDPCYASAGAAACSGGYQWDLFDPVGGINMPAAWDITTGSAGINVAVIDTGALFNHPDLAGRFVGGYDMIADCAVANDGQPGPCTWSGAIPNQTPSFTSRDNDASDPGDWVTGAENAGSASVPPYSWFQGCGTNNSSFHGTHVAGTIGAVPNNGIGTAGINWVSKIVPVRVLGKCGGYTSDIAAALIWAAGGSVSGVPANVNPARVLNLSLGGGGSCDTATQNAINTALSLGAVVVVAAGNNNANAAAFSPASCNGVITVAATNQSGRRSWYSNYGASVEIAAPGGSADGSDTDIVSTLNNGSTSPNPNGYIYARYAGTSMATPHVSGVASLMLSVNPALTPAQVLSKMQTTARAFPTPGPACGPTPPAITCNCTTALCGAGILDAAAAVAAAAAAAAAGGGGPAPTSITVDSLPNPSAVGSPVTFTATVTGANPTGNVNFNDSANSINGCAAVALAGTGNSRTARCTTSALAQGTHSITASYGGDAGNTASATAAALLQVVNAAMPSSTSVIGSPNPSTVGATVTFTAIVAGTNPTGNVNFKDGANSITGCAAVALTGFGNSRTARCFTSTLAQGTHSITASYGGDAGNTPSTTTTALLQVVNAAGPSSIGLISSLNPSTVGTAVTFTATVTGTNPTGNVNFNDGTSSITGCAAVALSGSGNSRTARCTTSALNQGTHSITASYGGDTGNAASTSAALTEQVRRH